MGWRTRQTASSCDSLPTGKASSRVTICNEKENKERENERKREKERPNPIWNVGIRNIMLL
jgi:hypothetical protein